MEVNGAVDVGQIAFQSTSEQVADEFRDRELSIMAELVEELFILVRNGCMNILISSKLLLGADNSHVFGLAVVNSRSAALIIQSSHLLMRV